mmetsp:Transcript_21633/g.47261  ORF Transcript_21633/g.47261 Transcript_21633/m.47261 type:complete len:269 (+) Transcript_21633:1657-2463(+)
MAPPRRGAPGSPRSGVVCPLAQRTPARGRCRRHRRTYRQCRWRSCQALLLRLRLLHQGGRSRWLTILYARRHPTSGQLRCRHSASSKLLSATEKRPRMLCSVSRIRPRQPPRRSHCVVARRAARSCRSSSPCGRRRPICATHQSRRWMRSFGLRFGATSAALPRRPRPHSASSLPGLRLGFLAAGIARLLPRPHAPALVLAAQAALLRPSSPRGRLQQAHKFEAGHLQLLAHHALPLRELGGDGIPLHRQHAQRGITRARPKEGIFGP